MKIIFCSGSAVHLHEMVLALHSLNNRYVLASVNKNAFSDSNNGYSARNVSEGGFETLSFLATTALDESSPFIKALAHNNSSNVSKAKQSSVLITRPAVRCLVNKHNSSNNHLNRPVTFHQKIKSSGYGAQNPRVTMFKPQIHKTQTKVKTSRVQLNNKLHSRYPVDSESSFSCLVSEKLEAEGTPIFAVSYSLTGDRVAVAQSNGLCSILRVGRKPDGKFCWKEESVLAGHGGIVSNVDWSLDGRLILTTSADRTARIWSVSGGILRLVISTTRGGSANGLGETLSSNSKGKGLKVSSNFADHVQFGKFHLEDNFFHLTCRNEIYFFKYKIDLNANALQRCHTVASCNRIAKFEFDNCTRLTAVSSTNLFYSYLLLAAGSDHSLSVLDINKKITVRSIPVVHDATVTGIAINQGSLYSSFTGGSALEGDFCDCGGSYSLFATAAPGDSVRLWDLRVARGHVAELARCRLISGGGVSGGSVRDAAIPPVTLVFSPCGKYVCFGALSSHKTASSQYLHPTVIDIRRACSPLAQLNFPNKRAGPSNAATVVAWNPVRSEITTGSLDGRLSVYG
nr:WD repeat containing protein 27 [Hymenolepis microstoma]